MGAVICLKVVHELKSLEGILAPVSKLDLGSDLQSVPKLQESFSITKSQFLVCTGLEIFTHHDSSHLKKKIFSDSI